MALTPPFATAADLPSTLTAAQKARAEAYLVNASQLILDEDTRGLFDELTEPTPTIVRITVAVAVRAAIPETSEGAAATQTSWGAGPFNAATTFANPLGDLYLTKAERRQLGFTKQRAGHVDMWAGAYETTV